MASIAENTPISKSNFHCNFKCILFFFVNLIFIYFLSHVKYIFILVGGWLFLLHSSFSKIIVYNVTKNKKKPTGTSIEQISATDLDSGINAEIR